VVHLLLADLDEGDRKVGHGFGSRAHVLHPKDPHRVQYRTLLYSTQRS